MSEASVPDKRARIVIRDHPVKVFSVVTDPRTPSGGVDLLGVVARALDTDEHVVWHGHAPRSAILVKLVGLAVLIPWCLYICNLAVASWIVTLPKGITWGTALFFLIVGLSQIALVCTLAIQTWRMFKASKFTLYAITNKRALKLSPAGIAHLKGSVPTQFEIKSCAPPPAQRVEDGQRIHHLRLQEEAHISVLMRPFLSEFEALPGANEALNRLEAPDAIYNLLDTTNSGGSD